MITDTMKQVYLLAQEHCGLKVGDRVKVTRKAEDYEAGWDNRWICDMNDTIDKIGRVETIGKLGVFVYFGKPIINTWNFPYFVLEKAEKPAHKFNPFDKVLVRDSNKEKWFPAFYAAYGIATKNHIVIGDILYKQCIPYKGNEHLVGTEDMPEE